MSDSSLLGAADDLRGVRSLVTALLGAKARLDRVAGLLAVQTPGGESTHGAWLWAALGIVSLRRSLNGMIGVASSAAPEIERPPSSPMPTEILR